MTAMTSAAAPTPPLAQRDDDPRRCAGVLATIVACPRTDFADVSGTGL